VGGHEGKQFCVKASDGGCRCHGAETPQYSRPSGENGTSQTWLVKAPWHAVEKYGMTRIVLRYRPTVSRCEGAGIYKAGARMHLQQ